MSFSHQRRIEFRDTDAAGIVHFSVFFTMMEEAEHAALRHLGLSVVQPVQEHSKEHSAAAAGEPSEALSSGLATTGAADHLTWPRVAARCDYLVAARFEDLLRIDVTVQRIGTTSVQYGFQFWRDAGLMAPERLAQGELTAVCCLWRAGHPLQKQPIPQSIRAALQQLCPASDPAQTGG